MTAPVHVDTSTAQTTFSDFGPHLMLDCRQCDYDKISDQAYVYKVLDELPAAIGMTKIFPPYVFPYDGLVPEDKGVSGVVLIAESHLTFHSFTDKDYFFFDIFSCKSFPLEPVIEYIIKAFGVGDYESHQVNRGRYFPRHNTPALRPSPALMAVSTLAPEDTQPVAEKQLVSV